MLLIKTDISRKDRCLFNIFHYRNEKDFNEREFLCCAKQREKMLLNQLFLQKYSTWLINIDGAVQIRLILSMFSFNFNNILIF